MRTHSRGGVEAIERIVGWPASSSLEWAKGFLAGIFDAEGGYSDGILRISNTDPLIIERIRECLERSGFVFALEVPRPDRARPVQVVRVCGGLREHLRFFHLVDPAIARKRDIEG